MLKSLVELQTKGDHVDSSLRVASLRIQACENDGVVRILDN